MSTRRPVADDGAADDRDEVAAAKRALRAPLLAARRARSEADRAAARAAIATHLGAALAPARCVAAYLPLPSEPLDRALLRALAGRMRVLIPVVTGPSPLDWCEFTDATRPGQLGIEEPDGPRLGPAAVTDADAVLVPALAVGPHGHRLGRGGGHYDRTLALRSSLRGSVDAAGDLLIALVYDEEFGLDVPHDDMDRPVSAVLTPSRGLLRLPPGS
ncbi:MAG TPA: 5-formyltetrahydrofolate cyclo-ligase [Nakamurella sp.]